MVASALIACVPEYAGLKLICKVTVRLLPETATELDAPEMEHDPLLSSELVRR